jgi:hypothetical protein
MWYGGWAPEAGIPFSRGTARSKMRFLEEAACRRAIVVCMLEEHYRFPVPFRDCCPAVLLFPNSAAVREKTADFKSLLYVHAPFTMILLSIK